MAGVSELAGCVAVRNGGSVFLPIATAAIALATVRRRTQVCEPAGMGQGFARNPRRGPALDSWDSRTCLGWPGSVLRPGIPAISARSRDSGGGVPTPATRKPRNLSGELFVRPVDADPARPRLDAFSLQGRARPGGGRGADDAGSR